MFSTIKDTIAWMMTPAAPLKTECAAAPPADTTETLVFYECTCTEHTAEADTSEDEDHVNDMLAALRVDEAADEETEEDASALVVFDMFDTTIPSDYEEAEEVSTLIAVAFETFASDKDDYEIVTTAEDAEEEDDFLIVEAFETFAPAAIPSEEEDAEKDGSALVVFDMFDATSPIDYEEVEEDRSSLIAVAFETFAPVAIPSDDEDYVIVASDEGADGDDDIVIVEAFETFADTPSSAPEETSSFATKLENAVADTLTAVEEALAAAKQYAINAATSVAVSAAIWAIWYAGIWIKEYIKIKIELEVERRTAAIRAETVKNFQRYNHTQRW